MSKQFLLFIKRLTIYSIIIILISFFITRQIPLKYITPALPYLLLFFFFITLLAYYIIIKASEKKFSSFVTTFMLTTFLRLMLYIAIMLIYLFLINPEDSVAFIGTFFIYYLLYTIFETVYVLISTKNNKYK